MEERWYNSNIATGIGWGAVILAATFGFGKGCGCNSPGMGGYSASELEMARIEQGYTIQQKDLNGDGKPEIFCEIDGIRYFSSIDGKPVLEAIE